MKTLKSLLYVLLATFLFAGCTDDDTVGVGEQENPDCYGVYFPSQTNAGNVELDPSAAPELTFTARRTRSEDAITVPVVIKASEDIFTATAIEFADGQEETTFTISFPDAEIGTPYSCEVQIEDPAYAPIYGERATGFSFSVTRIEWVLVTGPNGETKGKWRDDLFSSLFNLPGTSYGEKEVEIYERADRPGYYRIKDIYDADYINVLFGGNYGGFTPTYTILDATNPDMIYLPEQWTGRYVGSDGVLGFASNVSQNGFRNGSDYGTNENGVITFPANGVLVNFDSDPEDWYYGNGSGMLRIMLPGSKAYDYTLSLTAGEPADGKVGIGVRFGADVAKVKYAFYTGSTNDATVGVRGEEIANGEIESAELTEAGTVEAQFDATGAYSMVAVAYNAQGAASGSAYANFGYVAPGDEEAQAVVMTVLTELTNEYAAQGITKENSIKVIMYGQNIVSGYYALVSTASIAGLTEEQLLQALPSAGDAFTEEELEDVNGAGWVDTFIRLSKGTSYTMLVSVNNGYYTKLYAVEQTTQGDPDPLDVHYTADDLIDYVSKEDLLGKTWDYYAVLPQDKEDPVNRWYLGPVTFTENTTDDVEGEDYITAQGMTGLASALEGGDDSWPVLWDNGFIYPKAMHSFNKFQSYYVTNLWTWEEDPKGLHQIDYALVGAYVGDGLVALVGNNNYAAEGYTFNGVYFGAFNDAEFTDQVGYLDVHQYMLLADPAIYPTPSAASSAVAKAGKALHRPTNFVELRGPELVRALRMERLGGLKACKAAIKGESVSRPAAARTSFKAGQFPQHSGNPAEKKTVKTRIVDIK